MGPAQIRKHVLLHEIGIELAPLASKAPEITGDRQIPTARECSFSESRKP